MKHVRILCLVLAVLLVLPLGLSGCTNGGNGTETDTSTASGTDAGTDAPSAETDAPGTSGEETGEADTDPSGEAETFADPAPVVKAYPDFAEYETVSVEAAPDPEVVRVEGENFNEVSMKYYYLSGSEFSEGKTFISQYDPATMDDLWVEYIVTVEQGGVYDLTMLCTPSGQSWTCDYFISANGNEPETEVRSYAAIGSFNCPTLNDNGVFKVMSVGTVTLEPGDNTIRITMDPNDGRDASFGNKMVFFLDWLEVSIGGGKTGGEAVSVSYAAAPLGDSADVLNGAANVSVFDCSYPIRFDVSVNSDGKKETPWKVTDYYGNTVWEGKLPASRGKVTLSKAVADHPTGYFHVTVGSTSIPYVVTPPLHTEAYEDSPFAMDYAAAYLMSKSRVYDVASAARLMGVTWVRERCNWSSYEAQRGTYDYSSTDSVYNDIHRAGLKNLAMLCASPAWATTSYKAGAQNVCDGMIGGFRDHQPDAYRLTKAMAQHYDGIVDAWELWNETDINGFAIEPAELYASWYKAAALGVMDSGVKNTLISFGGLCQGYNTDYMSLFLQNNVLDYAHIFNYHQHATYNGNFMDYEYALMQYMNATAPAYFKTEKPMWVTEAGMKLVFADGVNKPTAEQLAGQTPYIITSTVQSLKSGTDRHYWFVLAPYIEVGGDFGTFSASYEPYPTVAAEAVMTNELGKGKYIGVPDDLPSACGGALFDTGRGMTAVLWSENWKKNNIKYTFASEYPVVRTDMMGKREVVEPVDGVVTILVDKYPCYVTYKTVPAYTPQSFPERTYTDLSVAESGRVILTPLFDTVDLTNDKNGGHVVGDSFDLRVRVLNLNDHEVTGSVTGSCPGMTVTGAENVTVPAMGETTVTVTVQNSEGGAFDRYLTLTGTFGSDGGTSVSVSRIVSELGGQRGNISFTSPRRDEQTFREGCQSMTAEYSGVKGTVGVWINGAAFTAFTVKETENGGTVTIDTSSLGKGEYFVSVGVMPEGGEYRFAWISFTNE